MPITDHISEARELDARAADGIEVRLLWYPASDTVTVAVFDATHENAFEVTVDSAEALEAFHHPFAYADNYDAESSCRPGIEAKGRAPRPR